jgi:ubiquinone/menaquinone biosynthesis C-methylase UbiE
VATTEKEEIDSQYYNEHIFSADSRFDFMKDLNSPFQKYRVQKVLQIYTPKKNDAVLDLGCGWGTFCFALAPICKHVTGLDYSGNSIKLCKKLSKKYPFKNIDFILSDARNTGLKSESYDVIISADLFEHLYPQMFEETLDECRRLLKKGGKLVIWTPHRGYILEILKNNNIILKKDLSHVDYKLMPRLLDALNKRNFRIKKSYYAESHVPIALTIEKILLPFLPLMRRRIAILAEKID